MNYKPFPLSDTILKNRKEFFIDLNKDDLKLLLKDLPLRPVEHPPQEQLKHFVQVGLEAAKKGKLDAHAMGKIAYFCERLHLGDKVYEGYNREIYTVLCQAKLKGMKEPGFPWNSISFDTIDHADIAGTLGVYENNASFRKISRDILQPYAAAVYEQLVQHYSTSFATEFLTEENVFNLLACVAKAGFTAGKSKDEVAGDQKRLLDLFHNKNSFYLTEMKNKNAALYKQAIAELKDEFARAGSIDSTKDIVLKGSHLSIHGIDASYILDYANKGGISPVDVAKDVQMLQETAKEAYLQASPRNIVLGLFNTNPLLAMDALSEDSTKSLPSNFKDFFHERWEHLKHPIDTFFNGYSQTIKGVGQYFKLLSHY